MENDKLYNLLKKMTLEEKVDQLVMLDSSVYKPDAEVTGPKVTLGFDDHVIQNMGAVYNVFGAEKLQNIQKEHLEKNRLGIPLLFCADIIYGYKTVLPIPLAFGCSWDTELIEKCYEMIAKESSATGIHAVFSPMVDLVRDPRWGRVMESCGEDTYLNSCLARAEVRGLQGKEAGKEVDIQHVASCVKHFAAYGAPEGGREYNTVDMSERKLRQEYLPAYQSAVQVGCKMIMTSFNTVDGIPSSGNSWLMRDVLRDEWGFQGTVVSDYAAIKELIDHGVAKDEEEAAILALKAGVDMDMKTPVYEKNIGVLIKEGKISEELLDEAVLRILTLKNELGLFEDPYRGITKEREQEQIATVEHKEVAYKLATESLVLLKNQFQVLPLSTDVKVALVGPFGKEKHIHGMWAIAADMANTDSLFDAITNKAGTEPVYAKGCAAVDDYSFLGEFAKYMKVDSAEVNANQMLEEALKTVEKADVIVLTLGEHAMQSGEAASKMYLSLPDFQKNLIIKLKETGKPVITLIYSGRPLLLNEIEKYSDAVLQVWWPGSEGSRAIVDVLYGDVNPSGKLSMTFPLCEGQIPVYYNEFKTGRPYKTSSHTGKFVSKYIDGPNEPLYTFGYGMSYTKFFYSKIRTDSDRMSSQKQLIAEIDVTNIGKCKGTEIVQLYIQDIVGSVVRPILELRQFLRIELQSGETKTLKFIINEEDLKFFTKSMKYEAEEGEFTVFIGGNIENLQETTFRFTKNYGE